MMPQFENAGGWRMTKDNLATGSGFFLVGLLKKTLLADPLSAVVAAGFADPGQLALFSAWQAAASYSLMLYFDFSGYTDMAIGLAWIAGLRFPDNFDQPYRATSVIAYWQRWHMSLTRFLMTNVHAPLTLAIMRWRRNHGLRIDARGQRTASGFCCMLAAPATVTMMLVALWHGATFPFLCFGLLHAAFLVVNHGWRLAQAPSLPKVASIALTYLCVLIGSVLFRAFSVADAWTMLTAMFGAHGIGLRLDIQAVVGVLWLASLYAVVWFAPSTRQWMQAEPASRFGWRPSPQWAMVMGCGATLGLLAAGGSNEFLYFKF